MTIMWWGSAGPVPGSGTRRCCSVDHPELFRGHFGSCCHPGSIVSNPSSLSVTEVSRWYFAISATWSVQWTGQLYRAMSRESNTGSPNHSESPVLFAPPANMAVLSQIQAHLVERSQRLQLQTCMSTMEAKISELGENVDGRFLHMSSLVPHLQPHCG